MRTIPGLIVSVSLLLAGFAPAQETTNEADALMSLDEAWSESAGNVEKFMSFFAPDASFYPQGKPVASGDAAIREVATQFFAMPGFSVRWTPTRSEISGDLGYTAGTYVMNVNDPEGNPVTEKGKYVCVWKKQSDGQWKALHDIFNSDSEPTAPPAQ